MCQIVSLGIVHVLLLCCHVILRIQAGVLSQVPDMCIKREVQMASKRQQLASNHQANVTLQTKKNLQKCLCLVVGCKLL